MARTAERNRMTAAGVILTVLVVCSWGVAGAVAESGSGKRHAPSTVDFGDEAADSNKDKGKISIEVESDGDDSSGRGGDDGSASHPIDFVPTVILEIYPPDGAIDARQPHELDGSGEMGWDVIEFVFSIHGGAFNERHFKIHTDPPGFEPEIAAVVSVGSTVEVQLDDFIPIGVWTTVTFEPTGRSVSIAHLPGDVNNDGAVTPLDITALIDHANGVETLQPYQVDIAGGDGVVGGRDIMRLIDLLNGANTYEAYLGYALPMQ